MKSKRVINGLLVTLFSIGIFAYLIRSSGPIPIMDFWVVYADKIDRWISGYPMMSDFVMLPHRIHWNPFCDFAYYFFIKYLLCDNRIIVLIGGVFLVFSMGVLTKITLKRYDFDIFTNILAIASLLLTISCLNQWEILTLFCGFAFTFRIFTFLVSFYMIERIVLENACGCKYAIKTSILCVMAMLLWGQAYLLGYYLAISIVLFVDFILKIRRQKSIKGTKTILIVEGSITIALLFYIITLDNSSQAKPAMDIISYIVLLMKSVVLMLGSTIVPTDKINENGCIAYAAGIAIFVIAMIAVLLYMKNKMYKRTIFPMLCLFYAFFSDLVIAYGRVGIFGIMSVTSSRYVTETILAIIGVVYIIFDYIYFLRKQGKLFSTGTAFSYAVIMLLLVGIMISDITEWRTGPGRKAYNEAAVKMALDIDNQSDEDLGIFQAYPGAVRQGISSMQHNKICVFSQRVMDGYGIDGLKVSLE